MVNVIKRRAGSDSHGNTWDTDGATVDVDPEVAAELLAIPDGGFELASDEPVPPAGGTEDSNRPGGVLVDNKAGSEPGAGDTATVPEEPAAKPAAKPAPAEEPAEQPAEEPAEQPAEQSAEKAVDKKPTASRKTTTTR